MESRYSIFYQLCILIMFLYHSQSSEGFGFSMIKFSDSVSNTGNRNKKKCAGGPPITVDTTRFSNIGSNGLDDAVSQPVSDTSYTKSIISCSSVYFGIKIDGTNIGRLIFHLTNPSPLPKHAENFVRLVKGTNRGIDPLAHYTGCQFDFNPSSVEEVSSTSISGRYRWCHQLKGRGRNAFGRPDSIISDPYNQLLHTHTCFGGQYYGDQCNNDKNDVDSLAVYLTVPIGGPGHGRTKFSIVRCGESPKEWGERLLINSGVIGKLDPISIDVLRLMARQNIGPPTVFEAGAL